MIQPTAATGIEGLDDILRGGFPAGRILLVEGDPGVGKTTLALQFLLEGAKRGERSIYVALSETREELTQVADSHGWSLDGIDLFELAPPKAFTQEEQNTLFHPSEVELAEMTKAVADLCDRVNPRRLVFDSLSEIRLLAQSALRYRREVLTLKQFFAGKNCTVLLLDDRTDDGSDGHLQSIAHGVVTLERLIPLFGSHRRRLRVTKLRGVDFRGGYHDFIIRKGGLDVFPRLVAAERGEPVSAGAASSGVPQLDAMLGGDGLDRGTSALFLGPPGTGKSALATQWALAAAQRGEHAAIYSFDESVATLERRSAGLNMDLRAQVRAGNIVVRQIDPAEIAPGQLTQQICESVERGGIRLVVIDSLNGYLNAMPEESFLVLQLHELLAFLGRKGVVTILVVAQHGLVGAMASPVDVTYLADTVVLFRHFEAVGALHKAISVLKKRTGGHEASIRELLMGPTGVSAGAPLSRFRGVLTGVPTYDGTVSELANVGNPRNVGNDGSHRNVGAKGGHGQR
jgi:circadian clock protein KaiC